MVQAVANMLSVINIGWNICLKSHLVHTLTMIHSRTWVESSARIQWHCKIQPCSYWSPTHQPGAAGNSPSIVWYSSNNLRLTIASTLTLLSFYGWYPMRRLKPVNTGSQKPATKTWRMQKTIQDPMLML